MNARLKQLKQTVSQEIERQFAHIAALQKELEAIEIVETSLKTHLAAELINSSEQEEIYLGSDDIERLLKEGSELRAKLEKKLGPMRTPTIEQLLVKAK